MAEFGTEHFRIVKEAVEGNRQVDDQTLASVEALSKRLERIKKMDKIFDDVQFSLAVKRIITQKDALTVG